ncbi:hypothetical protein HK098_002406 [Nowakowskiella sp. JEL0407]|nr:hypothetical protein HK098_002406 [Nowakowskiella sp. JEL0407]
MVRSIALISLFAFALNAHAQTCVPATRDLITLKDMPAGGLRSPTGTAVDNAGGSYGGVGVTYTFNGAAGTRVIPTDLKNGYWFFKFEPRECWNALGYRAFEFDYQAPVGADVSMTLTFHTAACLTNNCTANADSCPREPDSTYVPLSTIGYNATGRLQHVIVPFELFDGNSFGNGTTDFRYIKDFTFIAFTALNQPYIFNNFIVKAGCRTRSTTTARVGAIATATGNLNPGAITAPGGSGTVANAAITAAPTGATSAKGAGFKSVSYSVVLQVTATLFTLLYMSL